MVENNPEQEDGNSHEGQSPAAKHHDDAAIAVALRALLQEYKTQSDNQEGWEQQNITWTKRAFWGLVGYTLISGFALGAVIYGNHINSQALVSTQRAYVAPIGLKFSVVTDKNGKYPVWYAKITLENSGNTATKDMSFGALHFTWERQLFTQKQIDAGLSKQLIPVPSELYQRAALGPRERLPIRPFTIGYDNIKGIKRETRQVYIYGTIIYRDIFPKTPWHVTEFCYHIRAAPVIFGNPAHFDMTTPSLVYDKVRPSYSMCRHHDCTDSECNLQVRTERAPISPGKKRHPASPRIISGRFKNL